MKHDFNANEIVNVYSTEDDLMYNQILELKHESGSHSPSINTIRERLPKLQFKVDACFLSNPYATNLFMEYFQTEVVNTGRLREILEFYPSQMSVIAKKLGKALGVSSKNIFVGNGAIEPIQAVIHNFVKKRILVNIPTFSSYYEFVREDVQVVYNRLLPDNDFEISIDNLVEIITTNEIDSLVLINPNNPDGSYLCKDKITDLLERLRHLETIIIDESFVHFAYESDELEPISFIDMVNYFPNLVVVKSMSKDFGIAGLRAGYAVMRESRVTRLSERGYLWNVNGLAEYFFDLYTKEDFLSEYDKLRKRYIAETKDFYKELSRINGIKTHPTRANFILIELLNGMLADEFVFRMLVRYGVYTRTCSDKIGLGNKYVRVASRGKEENARIIEAFKGMLGE